LSEPEPRPLLAHGLPERFLMTVLVHCPPVGRNRSPRLAVSFSSTIIPGPLLGSTLELASLVHHHKAKTIRGLALLAGHWEKVQLSTIWALFRLAGRNVFTA